MIVLTSLLTIDKKLSTPVYLQLANGITGLVRKGILKPGTALPSSRELAQSMQLHRKTVIAAYDELYAQNWVEVYPRKGIFIAKNLPVISSQPLPKNSPAQGVATQTHYTIGKEITLRQDMYKALPGKNLVINDGFPDTRLAPVDLLVREYRRFGNYHFTQRYLGYGPEQGAESLRRELARFFAETRGLHAGPENIMITKGVQMAMYLVSQLLLSKNDTVIVPDPGYQGANDVFEQAGARLAFVPVDDKGMDMAAVEEVCKNNKVKLLYVIPHHHRPTTVTLSPERRMQLLELARKYRFAIIEDDYDYDFRYDSNAVLPLASADDCGSVIYVGSFAKTLAPGIRIGFMVAPQNLIMQAARLRKLIDRQGEQLLEEAMANLLKNGDIGRHLKKTNKLYHERRDVFCALLNDKLHGKVSFKIPHGGFAVWTQYLQHIQPKQVAEKASVLGLTLSNGTGYYQQEKDNPGFVRLGFASMNVKELEQAVDILAAAIAAI
jgi:GntR family transcriptional regulator/MocR family aminotransferase